MHWFTLTSGVVAIVVGKDHKKKISLQNTELE